MLMFAFLVFVLGAYLFFCIRFAYWKNLNVPYEKPSFLVGSTGSALIMRNTVSNICGYLHRKHNECRYIGFFNMWAPAIVVRDPEIIKDILIKQYKSYRNWIQVADKVDTNLSLNPFIIYGEKWKTVRSNLTSQFTSAKIKGMLPIILSVSEKMTNYIKQKANNDCAVLSGKNLTMRFTGDNVYSCAFGLDARSFSDLEPEPLKIGNQISTNSVIIQIKQAISVFFPKLTNFIKCTFIGDPVVNTFKNMILASCKFKKDGVIKKDYLEHLIELKERKVPYFKTEADLVGHAFTFFLNGFETSGSTFLYALFELAKNPHIQDKAREEISRVLEKYNTITYEAFLELQYIENIILETLRMYPIIKFLGRVCLEDVTFPSPYPYDDGKNVTIKKGTEIFISVQQLHRDANYYANPEEFNPDRFSDNSQNLNLFLGFGTGPRICLGKSFALAQLKLGLTEIISKFVVELNEKTKLPLEEENIHLFLSPKFDVWLNFKTRL